MGTLDIRFGKYTGLVSAALFIVTAFIMILEKKSTGGWAMSSTAEYVLAAAGAVAIVSGVLTMLSKVKFVVKIG